MPSDQKFQKACSEVEKNNTNITQPTLLKLYSYYKQATEGDATGKRPGLTNLRNREKACTYGHKAYKQSTTT